MYPVYTNDKIINFIHFHCFFPIFTLCSKTERITPFGVNELSKLAVAPRTFPIQIRPNPLLEHCRNNIIMLISPIPNFIN